MPSGPTSFCDGGSSYGRIANGLDLDPRAESKNEHLVRWLTRIVWGFRSIGQLEKGIRCRPIHDRNAYFFSQ